MNLCHTCSSPPPPHPVIRACLLWGWLTLLGCGGVPTGEVRGKVTYQGKTVTGGSLVFSPVAGGDNTNPGPPATAAVGQHGSYAASPVVAGTNQVNYFPPAMSYPAGHEPQPGEPLPTSGFEGLVPRQQQVTVGSGTNTIDVELVPRPKGRWTR